MPGSFSWRCLSYWNHYHTLHGFFVWSKRRCKRSQNKKSYKRSEQKRSYKRSLDQNISLKKSKKGFRGHMCWWVSTRDWFRMRKLLNRMAKQKNPSQNKVHVLFKGKLITLVSWKRISESDGWISHWSLVVTVAPNCSWVAAMRNTHLISVFQQFASNLSKARVKEQNYRLETVMRLYCKIDIDII